MIGQCKCGSFAINDDPNRELCDLCWRDVEIERLRAERIDLVRWMLDRLEDGWHGCVTGDCPQWCACPDLAEIRIAAAAVRLARVVVRPNVGEQPRTGVRVRQVWDGRKRNRAAWRD